MWCDIIAVSQKICLNMCDIIYNLIFQDARHCSSPKILQIYGSSPVCVYVCVYDIKCPTLITSSDILTKTFRFSLQDSVFGM